jgi:ribosomal-protein-alanine N-acetyltransferase
MKRDRAGKPEPVMRPIEMKDLDRIHQLEVEIFANPWSRRSFASEIRKDRSQTRSRVLEIDGEVIGFIISWFIVDEVHLANVAVAIEHRHRGYGRALVEWLIEEARAASMSLVTLEVRVTNVEAIRLYERLGFVSVGLRPGYYHDGDLAVDARIMMLPLRDSGL